VVVPGGVGTSGQPPPWVEIVDLDRLW
jgi:hypothetical protein